MSIITLGFAFGIDLLFWAWVIVTVLAFIDLFIPIPIPADKIILMGGSITLLTLMMLRDIAQFFKNIKDILGHPLVLSFTISIAALWIGYTIYKKNHQGKRK